MMRRTGTESSSFTTSSRVRGRRVRRLHAPDTDMKRRLVVGPLPFDRKCSRNPVTHAAAPHAPFVEDCRTEDREHDDEVKDDEGTGGLRDQTPERHAKDQTDEERVVNPLRDSHRRRLLGCRANVARERLELLSFRLVSRTRRVLSIRIHASLTFGMRGATGHTPCCAHRGRRSSSGTSSSARGSSPRPSRRSHA